MLTFDDRKRLRQLERRERESSGVMSADEIAEEQLHKDAEELAADVRRETAALEHAEGEDEI